MLGKRDRATAGFRDKAEYGTPDMTSAILPYEQGLFVSKVFQSTTVNKETEKYTSTPIKNDSAFTGVRFGPKRQPGAFARSRTAQSFRNATRYV
jgi:hypothetical protein